MATARSHDDFLIGVSKFIDELVDHELLMRNVVAQGGPVHNKRRQLARILYVEYIQNIPPAIAPQNVSLDLLHCGNFITRCQVDLLSTDATAQEKAMCTLKHLQYKISRISCTSQADMDSCQRLMILLRLVVNTQNSGVRSSTPNTASQSNAQSPQSTQAPSTQNTASGSASTATNNWNAQSNANPQANLTYAFGTMSIDQDGANVSRGNSKHTHVQRPKIYKWNIKFSNQSKSLGVFEFIQKVEAKAMAYEVSHEQLFQSACELFDGFAAKWFLSQKFRNWNEIKEKLISDFVQVDYLENLLDTIRQRKQEHNEAIVHFFTVFEDDCSRLPVQLSVDEKLNILKKNILQKYRPYVALNKFDSVDDLKHSLKVLEMSMSSNISHDNSKFVRFNSKDRSAYSNDYRERNHSSDRNRSRYDKFHSNSPYDRTDNRNRSASNSSHHSGDASHSRSNYDRKPRAPTPSHRYNLNDKNNASRDRSNSRNSERSHSHERKNDLN